MLNDKESGKPDSMASMRGVARPRLPDTQLGHPSFLLLGKRQVLVPGMGQAPEPLLSLPISNLLCVLSVTADTWDTTF
jgi:hypothetical protein